MSRHGADTKPSETICIQPHASPAQGATHQAVTPDPTRAVVLAAVRAFTAFTPDNDPHGEHDFGFVEVGTVRCFWKVDCHDRDPMLPRRTPPTPP